MESIKRIFKDAGVLLMGTFFGPNTVLLPFQQILMNLFHVFLRHFNKLGVTNIVFTNGSNFQNRWNGMVMTGEIQGDGAAVTLNKAFVFKG